MAATKYLQTLSVVVFWLPFLDRTTDRSFSSSQSADVSAFFFSSSSSRLSVYRFFFSVLRSTDRSCENLHFLPFSQSPFLKKMHTTVLGSTPKGTFCTCAGLLSSISVSRLASSAAFLSRSRWAFSASLRFCSALPLPLRLLWIWAICFWAAPPFLFFMPKVRSSTVLAAFLGSLPLPFLGGMVGG